MKENFVSRRFSEKTIECDKRRYKKKGGEERVLTKNFQVITGGLVIWVSVDDVKIKRTWNQTLK